MDDYHAYTSTSGGGGGGKGCFLAGAAIIPLAYLIALISGEIPSNGFTLFIGLICLGYLIYKRMTT